MDMLPPITNSFIAFVMFVIVLFVDLVIRLALLFYVPRNRKPTAATAWLLTIFILPLIGTFLFFVIGNTKLSKSRRVKQKYASKKLQEFARTLKAEKIVAPIRTGYHNSAALAQSFGDLPPLKHNSVKIVSGYDNIIEDMTKAIDSAQKYVYVEFFIMALDATTKPFFDAMERAVSRNVRVYVLFDHFATRRYKHYREMRKRLTSIGVRWRPMLPISVKRRQYNRPDLRNHRKIVVIDNEIAYLGSLNLIERSYQRKDALRYLELTARMQGPVVNECAAVFASDWYAETGKFLTDYARNEPKKAKHGHAIAQVLPSGPGYDYENNLKFFVSLIYSAKKSIVITNPYLVPDESLLTAIISAAKRGIKISILNSEIMDQFVVGHAQRSYYDQIMSAGVEIHLYKSPILNHSKYMVVDSAVSVVGSSNLDVRSFELDLECVSIFYDKRVSKKLHDLHMKQCREESTQLALNSWRKRSMLNGLIDGIARLTSALQ